MKIGSVERAILVAGLGAILATACTTINPYTNEEQTARAQRGAVIGAIQTVRI